MTYRDDENFAARLAVARQRLLEKRQADDLERREKLAAEEAEEARLEAFLARASKAIEPLFFVADTRGTSNRSVYVAGRVRSGEVRVLSTLSSPVCLVAGVEEELGSIMETAEFASKVELTLEQHRDAEQRSLVAAPTKPSSQTLLVAAWAPLIAGYVLWACEVSVPGFLSPILCLVSTCMFVIGWVRHHGRKS